MLQVVSPAEAAVNSQLGVVAAAQAGGAGVGGYHGAPANKLQRSDRIEVREKNIFIKKKQKKENNKNLIDQSKMLLVHCIFCRYTHFIYLKFSIRLVTSNQPVPFPLQPLLPFKQ